MSVANFTFAAVPFVDGFALADSSNFMCGVTESAAGTIGVIDFTGDADIDSGLGNWSSLMRLHE